MIVTVKADFDLHLALMGGQAFRWRLLGDRYRGVIGGLLLEIERLQDVFRISVLNRASFPQLLDDEVHQYVQRYFRSDENPQDIQRMLSEDKVLAPLVRELGVIRILRQDPWECIVSYICSIDSNIPKIRMNVASICRSWGKEIAVPEGGMEHGFPSIQAIAESSEEALRSVKVGFRAPYLLKTARNLCERRLDFRDMEKQNIDEARSILQSFSGIGPKVSDCILLYSLDHLDAFPIDRWVRRAVSQLYFNGQNVPDKEIRAWALAHFGSLSGYAQQYLFEWSRSEKISGA